MTFIHLHVHTSTHAKVEKLEKKTYKVEKIVKSTKIPIKPKKSQKKPKGRRISENTRASLITIEDLYECLNV